MIPLCTTWFSTETGWSDADWTWDDCQLVGEICTTWANTAVKWSNVNWLWSECSGSSHIPLTPTIEIGNAPGVDATTLDQPWIIEAWNPYQNLEKKKRLVKLICKVKDIRYEEEKEVKDFHVSIDDVKMVVKAVANIDLKLEK